MHDIPKIDIRPDHWEIVRHILHKHVPDYDVWAFGSRAKWTAKQYSDLDLAVITDKPLSLEVSANLSDDFSESDLPWRVDVVDWASTQDNFKKIIERDRVVVQRGTDWSMRADWNSISIDEIKSAEKGAIAIGPFGSRMKSDCYVNEGIPVIRGTNITGGPTFEGEFVFITKEKADELGSCNVYKDDLVFPHRGSIGEVGIVLSDERYVISSSLMKLTCDKKKANPKFIYYFFKSRSGRHELLKNASQVGTPGIGQPLSSLKGISLNLPPLNIQNKISDILSSLDEKIHLNTQTNQTLESIAQAIFKSWFVDFDPVKAKIAALEAVGTQEAVELAAMCVISGKDEAQLAQLKKQDADAYQQFARTAALFPAAMQESELGEIPEGWEVKAIGDFGKVTTGKTPPQKMQNSYADTGIPFITPTDVTEEIFVTKTNRYLSEIGQSAIKNTKILAGSICVTCIGSQMGKAIVAPLDSFTNQQINTVIVKDRSHRNYLFLNLRNRRSELFLIGSSGSTMPIINKSTFEKLSVLLPHEQITKAFDRIIQPMINQILKNSMQNWSLTEIRDSLLPKLLSGEIDLSDIQSEVA